MIFGEFPLTVYDFDMIPVIAKNRSAIAELCKRLGIRRLELFGSAATEDFDPAKSDIDFFYEFDDDRTSLADRFFELKEELEKILGYEVDLVSAKDATNPYFLLVANRNRKTLYAA